MEKDFDTPVTVAEKNDQTKRLFEACKSGDLLLVKKLASHQNVNAKDTTGRKSSPLHFAAGICNRFWL